MKTFICNTARNLLLKTTATALTALLSLDATAQPTPAQVEERLEYAQCLRENGYPEWPDPTPDRPQMVDLKPGTESRFEAAESACTDKMPSGLAALRQAMTPERLDTLVKFAECMRAAGLSDFPDPTPEGVFELSSPTLDLRTPQAQQTMNTCREANAVIGLMIRRVPQ